MNKDFGFRVGTPFEIKSGLGDGKYVDLVGNNMVLKTQNGRTSQQWYFNQKTKTIQSWRTRSYSWNILSNGRNPKLSVAGTNS